jgi:predicted dehydrogenase
MSKSKTKNEQVKRISQLIIINPTAAGIDVSDNEMMVAYPINSEQLEVRVFGCFTRDLYSIVQTKRMSPGATNNWFIEVYGTVGSAKFSTHNPKAFDFLTTSGKEQGWTRIDIGSQSAIPSITGGIFEFGFSDAFQQMIGAFIHEISGKGSLHPFRNVTPVETTWSHELFIPALESHRTGRRIEL